jgi:hypothetical protein
MKISVLIAAMTLSSLCFAGYPSSHTVSADMLKAEVAKTLSKLMKPAIEAKDAPAACWSLGRVEGYALALDKVGDAEGKKIYELAKNNMGKCGGKNTLNLGETFTAAEWTRLSELQKKIENAGH